MIPTEPRTVILVYGPPGAGKSTYARAVAHALDLTIYDRDHPQWVDSERTFRQALAIVGRSEVSRAVVIRSGATRHGRAYWRAVLRPTQEIMLDTPADVCADRVRARDRDRPPMREQLAAIYAWHARHEPDPLPTSREWLTT